MRELPRRTFLTGMGTLAAGAVVAGCRPERSATSDPSPISSREDDEWSEVRAEFELDPEKVHLGALYIASHPRPVREAIEKHRRNLDRDPVGYLNSTNRAALQDVREAGADYLGVAPDELALTESTTMGVGLVYNGMRLEEGDEIVGCADDYYVTEESLRLAAERHGAVRRTVSLYDDPRSLSEDEIVHRLMSEVGDRTRVMAVTWVHSGTGLKLPLARLSQALSEANEGRDEDRRVLLCVDGVHGFGVEPEVLPDLGADFFMAGCHKWLFGPRGTGIVWAPRRNWRRVEPTIPSFTADAEWFSWISGGGDPGATTARSMSPGGFKAFEHRWALAEAFRFRERIGRERVAQRTRALCRLCKQGLEALPGVHVVTPMAPGLSSGIICFDVEGADPSWVVSELGERGIVATVTPYARVLVRFGPSILNTEADIDRAVRAVGELV